MTSVVAPNLKPKAENGCCSEISITSFIFFSRVLNIAKSCGRLLPPEKGKVFLPCHSTFESSCRRGCVDGYFAVGDNVATCRLTNSSEVAWDMGAFSCEGLY